MSLTRAVVGAAVGVALAGGAGQTGFAHNFPGPHNGWEVTQKSFARPTEPVEVNAHPTTDPLLKQTLGDYGWVLMPFPIDPEFTKFFDDTTLECWGAFDVVGSPNDTINVAMMVNYGWWGFQNLTGTVDARGHLITVGQPAFDFEGLPAGKYLINVAMASMAGLPYSFHAQAPNMKCKEIAEPPDQTKPPFHAPQE